MIHSFIHTSESNNFYIYDDQHRLSMLIHPKFTKVNKISTDVDPYYKGKYAYLINHGFFAKPKPANIETVVDESMVKRGIIQTKQIVFEVTDSCNLKCLYCVQGKLYEGFDKGNGKKINTNSAIKLLKCIFDLKHKNNETKLSISFYGGEPLLNVNFIKQIVEVVHQLNSKKEMDISFLMTTNATLIHKHIRFLAENKFKLMISLDGDEENHSYRFFRRNNKGSFEKVIENLDMIQKDYPTYFNENISFNAVLHNRNSVKDIYEFIYNRYYKIPIISELTLEHIKSDKKRLFNSMFHGKKKSEAEYQKKDSELLHITHKESLLFNELTDFLKYYSINFYVSNIMSLLLEEEKYLPTNTCFPFSIKIFLTNRNSLLPCEKTNYKYSLGKVNQNVIIDIPEITRQLNCNYEYFLKICQNCYVHRFCGLCMFRLENLDKLDTEEFICDRFHDQKAFQAKLCRIFSFLEKHPDDFSEVLENVIITS